MTETRPADYQVWDSIDPISVGHASHLWEGIEPWPNHKIDEADPKVYARQTALKTALHRLGYANSRGGLPKQKNLVKRAVWREDAKLLGERPQFLYPEYRPRQNADGTTTRSSTLARERMAFDAVREALRQEMGVGEAITFVFEKRKVDRALFKSRNAVHGAYYRELRRRKEMQNAELKNIGDPS